MIKIKLVPDFRERVDLISQLSTDTKGKWGDDGKFLIPLLLKADVAAVALENNSIIAFSIAKRIKVGGSLVIAYFATRVLPEFRNRGIATQLIKKIAWFSIIRNKFFNILNWFKPVYFVTATANPVVYENFRKHMRLSSQTRIAQDFSGIFSPKEEFNRETFVLSRAFLNSAEFYPKEEEIPWSNNQETNSILEDKIHLKDKTGDGLVVVARIF